MEALSATTMKGDNSMQDFITVHQIQVHLRDGLTITPEIKTMAAQFAEHRSRRPIVAYIDPKDPNQHHLNK